MVQFQSTQRCCFDLNLLPEQETDSSYQPAEHEPESDHQHDRLPEKESEPNHQLAQKKRPFRKAIGFKFNPSDVELVLAYLKPFSKGQRLPKHKIHERDIYVYHPDQLLVEFEKGNERDFYFFTPRSRLPNAGDRISRSANGGFWHCTTASKDIILVNTKVGVIQKFTFYNGTLVNGKPPKEGKTDWLMSEYRLPDVKRSSIVDDLNISEDSMNCVLSKVYRKGEECLEDEDYGEYIMKHQQEVIEDETLWEQM